jgi:hypothetical protein
MPLGVGGFIAIQSFIEPFSSSHRDSIARSHHEMLLL